MAWFKRFELYANFVEDIIQTSGVDNLGLEHRFDILQQFRDEKDAIYSSIYSALAEFPSGLPFTAFCNLTLLFNTKLGYSNFGPNRTFSNETVARARQNGDIGGALALQETEILHRLQWDPSDRDLKTMLQQHSDLYRDARHRLAAICGSNVVSLPCIHTLLIMADGNQKIQKNLLRLVWNDPTLRSGKDNLGRNLLYVVLDLGLPTQHEHNLPFHDSQPSVDIFKRSILHVASAAGNVDVVERGISHGYDVEAKDIWGQSPLSLAARNGHEDIVRTLIVDHEANVKSRGNFDGAHHSVEQILTTGRVDADSKDEDDRTPLSRAAQNGHKGVVELLLATDRVDADSKGSYGHRTPLSWAAQNGHKSVVEQLLATGRVDADSKDSFDCRTPLSWAAQNGHKGVVKLLLATGEVDADARDSYNRTPFSWAAKNGHKDVVELLLATGRVNADLKGGYDYRTPLSWAAENGHKGVVELLLATGRVNTDSKDDYSRTPLSWAALNHHKGVVKLLER